MLDSAEDGQSSEDVLSEYNSIGLNNNCRTIFHLFMHPGISLLPRTEQIAVKSFYSVLGWFINK